MLLALSVSFLCSILEAIILSITPSYIESLRQKGSRIAPVLYKQKEEIDKPLAAILSLNTIAHTVGSIGVGVQANAVWGDNSFTVGIVSTVMTLLILVLSEIIPKSLGANYWRQLAPSAARILQVLLFLLGIFVRISTLITRFIARQDKEAKISRAEISAMAEIGEQEGIFEEGESRALKNLLKFKQVKVKEIMTPRTVVVAIPEQNTIEETYRQEEYLRFTRMPIYQENIDQVSGFIHKHDLLYKMAKDEYDLPLHTLRRAIMRVSEKMPVNNLYEKLIAAREHIALVMDEYGGLAGVVTMEDVLETLLGIEIVDEFDDTPDLQAYAKEKWASQAKQWNHETKTPSQSATPKKSN